MRGNKGGVGGLEGYISCVYIRPASAAVWFSWSSLYEAKVKLEELRKKKSRLNPQSPPGSFSPHHRRVREADWASEQKAIILVTIYSYRPYTHIVTNNGFIDLQTMPGAVACLPFPVSFSLYVTSAATLQEVEWSYDATSTKVMDCTFSALFSYDISIQNYIAK